MSSLVIPFVGRQSELARLERVLENASEGRAGVVLLTGEAGIGKTRTVLELARRAGPAARVATGKCEADEGAPVYWPWIQVLRAILAEPSPGDLSAAAGPGMADLVRLLPELPEPTPAAPPVPEGAQARFRLFDAVARVLERIAQSTPLIVVIDDLHAADRASLLLLRFLARQGAAARLLIVATYRDTEAGCALAETVAELASEPHVHRLELAGLGQEDAVRLIETISGAPAPAEVVRRLHEETKGNPFFLTETVRLLVSEHRLERAAAGSLGLPHGVRAVLARRVERLPAPAPAVLANAAVVGHEVDLGLLGRLVDVEPSRLLDVLAPALEAQVVALMGAGSGRLRFVHGLVRETLYQGLSLKERARSHAHVVEVLETLHAGHLDEHLGELAYHAHLAAPEGDGARALDYAVRAAARALTLVAWEEAALHYQHALDLLRLLAPEDAARRVQLLLALAEAELRSGQAAAAREAFQRAAEGARALGSASDFARAVLGWAQRWIDPLGASPALLKALEEVLAMLPAGDSSLRARATASLGRLLHAHEDQARRAALAREALAMARRLGERQAIAAVLFEKHHTVWDPDNLDERLVESAEMVRLAEASGDSELALMGHMLHTVDLLERGDMVGARRGLLAQAALPAELRHPLYRHRALIVEATFARLAGRFDDAERAALEALHLGERAQNPSARGLYTVHRFDLLREQGGLDTLEASFRAATEANPGHVVWRAALASMMGELGRREDARRELDVLAARDFGDLSRDFVWLTTLAFAAEVTVVLGDARRAALLHALLVPYADRVVVGAAGLICLGPAAYYLGVLANVVGRHDEAEGFFSAAYDTCRRIGAIPGAVRTQEALGRLLLERGGSGNRDRASVLIGEAIQAAVGLGLPARADRLRGLRDGGRPRVVTLASAGDGCVFRREGEYWSIRFEGRLVRLRHSLGLAHLAQLLRHPGREFLAADLASTANGRPGDPAFVDLGDGGALLDAKALASYRRRLAALREQLDEAMASADTARSGALRSEMEFLTRELARGVGLSGRSRSASSFTERARINVTRTIKDAIRRVAAEHPALGRHFTATVRTGTYCSYVPDPRVPVLWK